MSDCGTPMCGETGLCEACRKRSELRAAMKPQFGVLPPPREPAGVTTVCPICGDMFTPDHGTLATCRLGCAATPQIALGARAVEKKEKQEPHHGPHERALVLSVEDRQELERFVKGGGYNLLRKIVHGPQALAADSPTDSQKVAMGFVELLLKIAKRTLSFQSHAEEAVIAYDHREQSIKDLRFRAENQASEFLIKELSHAWYIAGGRLEAIENGVGNVDLDWRRDVWRIVAEVAQAITQPTPMDRQCTEAALRFATNERGMRHMAHDEHIAWGQIVALLHNALNAPSKPAATAVLVGRTKPTKAIVATCAECTAGKVSRSDGVGGKWDETCVQCGGRGTVSVFL